MTIDEMSVIGIFVSDIRAEKRRIVYCFTLFEIELHSFTFTLLNLYFLVIFNTISKDIRELICILTNH